MSITPLLILFLSYNLLSVSSKTFLEHLSDPLEILQPALTIPISRQNTSSPISPPETNNTVQETGSDLSDNEELDSIVSLFNYSYFYGTWSMINNQVIPAFSNKEGFAYFHYDSQSNFPLDVRIYDGRYTDKKLMILLSHDLRKDAIFNNVTKTVTILNAGLSRQVGEAYGDLESPLLCPMNITAQFLDPDTLQPFNISSGSSDIGVKFIFESNVCAANFKTSLMTSKDPLLESQIIPYISIVSAIAISQCILLFYYQRSLERHPAIARRTSAWSIVVLNSFDLNFFLTITYFLINYSPVYELCSIPCAVLAFGFEPKIIWKILQQHRETPSPSQTRQTAEVKTYFCMLSLFLCGIASLLVYPDFTYFLSALYLAPQIRLNYLLSYKHRWNFWIMGGLAFPKIIYTLYAKLDPNNLYRVTPNWQLPAIVITLIILQLILLGIQTKYPRFGYEEKPAYLVYSYKEASISRNDVCAICLDRLKGSFGSNSSPGQSYIGTDTTLQDRRKISTPCQHEFHLSCLRQWLDSKLECPYCRKGLPNLPEEYLEE